MYTGAIGSPTEKVRIDSSGNVSIGTTGTNRKLTVTGSSTTQGTIYAYTNEIHTGTDTAAHVSIRSDNASASGDVLHVRGDGSGNLLTIDKSGTEKLIVDSSGNLLVGMTSTGSTGGMYIDQTGNVIAASVGANGTSTKFKWTSPAFNAGSQEKHGIQLYNGASQNIQFGFISDSGGNQGAFIDTSSTNLGTIIRSDTNGVRLANGATSWSSYSDSRLKDVTGEIPNALDKIDAMRGILFSWNDDGENTQRCGVIAQEVQAVLPEVVDTDTDYLQVRYTEIIPLLIQGIKEQQTIIKSLEARITALES
jgi:hypothetical protein